MERVFAGEIYDDLSTPLGALLTNNCALVRKDKELDFKSTYLLQKNPEHAKKAAEMDDKTWDRIKSYFIDELDFLSTPDWPDKPENGYIHPIYMCTKDSKMRADTLACIYEDGKWYRFGNMGNAKDTDVSVFKKWITKSEDKAKSDKPTLDSLPWNNAGPEILEIYQEFLNEKNEYIGPWFTLGIKLVGSGYWEQAFDCFTRCEKLHTHKDSERYISSLIWQGHIYDIWGEREKAVAKYKEALGVEGFNYMRHDQWGIVLNYEWVKQRLEKPFTKEMIGK
jgi:tetratricopeptide (TPR) repeat protein